MPRLRRLTGHAPHSGLSSTEQVSSGGQVDGQGIGLRRELQAKGIPFVLYTASKADQ